MNSNKRHPMWPARLGLAVALCALVGGAASAPPVHATTVAAVSLEEMTASADLVVIGWVAGVRAQRDQNGRIYTFVTLDGLKVIHGTHLEPTLELRFSGGAVDAEREYIAGMPQFAVGERGLLFVRGNGSEICPLVGWHQGRFRVETDLATGDDVLTDGQGNPVIGITGSRTIRYGARSGAVPAGEGSAGIPDDPDAIAAAPSRAASQAPLSLAVFLAAVDQLRGVAPALSQSPPPRASGQEPPADTLPAAVVRPSRQAVLGTEAVPGGLPDPEPRETE